MKKAKVFFGIILVCLSIMFMVSFALAEVGVTDNEIKIGTILDFTGPTASAGVPLYAGMKVAVKEINEKGGILGRKISLLSEDHSYAPPKAVAAANS